MALIGDFGRLRADVEALAGMVRDSAGDGERAAAAWIAGRLREVGAGAVAVEPFSYAPSYAGAHAAHALAGLLAARRGGVAGAALAAAALLSLEREASGRSQWIRRFLPASEGANVAARIAPAGGGAARRTLVLVAHHDAARTGLVWHRRRVEAGAARRLRRRRIDPYLGPYVPALALAGAPWRPLRPAGAALQGLILLADLDLATGETVPGASDNATGVAALLALASRWAAEPLPGVEVLVACTGCEEAGMGGMAAWLRAHGAALDSARTLVLGLDTLGAGTPIVLGGEYALRRQRYRPADVAWADAGAARAGLPPPERWTIGGWTDPILARHAGLPSVSLLSIGPKGVFTNYHRPSDTPERVDWESVERCTRLAAGVGEAFAAAR